MITLALDTSGKTQSVALLIGGRIHAELALNAPASHSETLLTSIDWVLKQASVRLAEVELFSLSVGPGSFTGLRIGISTVKAFCQARPRPVAPVSTLMAMAWPLLKGSRFVVAGLEAGSGETFMGAYRSQEGFPLVMIEDKIFSREELLSTLQGLSGEYFLGGSLKNYLPEASFGVSVPFVVEEASKDSSLAASIGILGEKMLQAGLAISGETLKPRYLRRSEAENRLLRSHQGDSVLK